ncbi:MAG: hypothetical protein JWN38_250 [Candidatus Saccharibacteria bacterium]|nr:hypothetical protein [Candidatus Saccharibacteria bacterium]
MGDPCHLRTCRVWFAVGAQPDSHEVSLLPAWAVRVRGGYVCSMMCS